MKDEDKHENSCHKCVENPDCVFGYCSADDDQKRIELHEVVRAAMNKAANITEIPRGAVRFDSGKPELRHIHPVAWHLTLQSNKTKLSPTIIALNYAMDQYYYYGVNHLDTAWANVGTEDLDNMTKVLEFGAKKYAALNYAKGMNYSRVIDSFRRHINKIIKGEKVDQESGIDHMGHIMCNFMFILTYAKEFESTEYDDRTILGEKK